MGYAETNSKSALSQQTQNICITFVQRGPTSSTLVQHHTNVIQIFCVSCDVSVSATLDDLYSFCIVFPNIAEHLIDTA